MKRHGRNLLLPRFVTSTFSRKHWRQGKEYEGKHNTGKRVLPMVSNARVARVESWRPVTAKSGRKMKVPTP